MYIRRPRMARTFWVSNSLQSGPKYDTIDRRRKDGMFQVGDRVVVQYLEGRKKISKVDLRFIGKKGSVVVVHTRGMEYPEFSYGIDMDDGRSKGILHFDEDELVREGEMEDGV